MSSYRPYSSHRYPPSTYGSSYVTSPRVYTPIYTMPFVPHLVTQRAGILTLPPVPRRPRDPYYDEDEDDLLYRGRTYHRAIPGIAHKRLTMVTAPPHSVKSNRIYSELERTAHRPRVMVNPAYLPDEDYLDTPTMLILNEKIRDIRLQAQNLLDKQSPSRFEPPVRRPIVYYTSSQYEMPETKYDNEYKIHTLRDVQRDVQDHVFNKSLYNEPVRRANIGKGHLSCMTYAGGKPQAVRRKKYVPDFDQDKVLNDVTYLSYYDKTQSEVNRQHTDLLRHKKGTDERKTDTSHFMNIECSEIKPKSSESKAKKVKKNKRNNIDIGPEISSESIRRSEVTTNEPKLTHEPSDQTVPVLTPEPVQEDMVQECDSGLAEHKEVKDTMSEPAQRDEPCETMLEPVQHDVPNETISEPPQHSDTQETIYEPPQHDDTQETMHEPSQYEVSHETIPEPPEHDDIQETILEPARDIHETIYEPSQHDDTQETIFKPSEHDDIYETIHEPPQYVDTPETTLEPSQQDDTDETIPEPPQHNDPDETMPEPPQHNDNQETTHEPSQYEVSHETIPKPTQHDETSETMFKPLQEDMTPQSMPESDEVESQPSSKSQLTMPFDLTQGQETECPASLPDQDDSKVECESPQAEPTHEPEDNEDLESLLKPHPECDSSVLVPEPETHTGYPESSHLLIQETKITSSIFETKFEETFESKVEQSQEESNEELHQISDEVQNPEVSNITEIGDAHNVATEIFHDKTEGADMIQDSTVTKNDEVEIDELEESEPEESSEDEIEDEQ